MFSDLRFQGSAVARWLFFYW